MNSPVLSKNIPAQTAHSDWYVASMERLIGVVQELSLARNIDEIMAIVRVAARELTGADGASFVLKDGDQCFYAEENAVGPLWKGRRFPMSMCISGWVMMNAKPAMIEDIYVDPRIPADAYRPTFVKSLVMMPVRRIAPIAAIGNYWASNHKATDEEVAILQALADTTSVALENVELYGKLNHKIDELEKTNHDLSCFAWAASHDLQEPLRTITIQMELLDRHLHGSLDERDTGHIRMAIEGAGRLQHLVQNLLAHAHTEKAESFKAVNLSIIADEVVRDLHMSITENDAVISIDPLPTVHGDPHLLECMLQNLISNAIKFHPPGIKPSVEVKAHETHNEHIISVKDNGVGIEKNYHQQIFGLFERLNTQDSYHGSGIGLATCRKISEIHGGRIWVESEPGQGSCFWVAIPKVEL